MIDAAIHIVSFYKFAIHQRIKASFGHLNYGLKANRQLREKFTNQFGMAQNFSHFHDSYYTGLHQVLPVSFNVSRVAILYLLGI